MRMRLLAILLFLSSFAQSQELPDHVGKLYVGKSLIRDYISFVGVPLREIIDIEEYRENLISRNSTTDEAGVSGIPYEIKNYGHDTIETSFNTLFPTHKGLRAFFVSHINVEGFPVNNLTVWFLNDTIRSLSYYSTLDVLDIMIEKYKGFTHTDSSRKKTTCRLKNGRFAHATSDSYIRISDDNKLAASIRLVADVSKSCKVNAYTMISITDTKFYDQRNELSEQFIAVHKVKQKKEAEEERKKKMNAF